ncbi:MAG: TIGR04279 domain-containing protein [Methanocellales archaeon]
MRRVLIITFFIIIAIASTASAEYLVWVKIDGENITFANHSSNLEEGNWIVLNGGIEIEIPELTFIYNGVNNTIHTHLGKTITINTTLSAYEDFSIKYPLKKHTLYINKSGSKLVNATFYGDTSFAGKNIDAYIIKTSPLELRDVLQQAIDGNTTPFRNLLNNSIANNLNQSLNSTGDLKIFSIELDAGDYIAIVKLNESNNNLTILSATGIEVLEYSSTLTAPSSATIGDSISATIALQSASPGSYRYGAIIIHEQAYNAVVKLRCNGTRAGTNLTADGEFLVEGLKIVGTGLNYVNAGKVKSIAEGIIGANNGAASYSDPTTDTSKTLSLNTDGLNPGRYILMVGVWQSGGNRLVAFAQQNITLAAPTPTAAPPAPGGGGGVGGAPPSLPGVTIEISITRYIDYGIAGRDYTVNVTYPNLSVTELGFGLLQSVKEFSVTVQKISGAPTGVPPAPGRVYSYLNIYIGLPSSFYSSVIIKFHVDRAWLASQGINENDIALYVYRDGNWIQLPTRIIGRDGFISYEATSTSFSIYAISTLPVTPTPTPTPVITPTPTPTITPTPFITPTITPTPAPGFEAIIALIVLVALARWKI